MRKIKGKVHSALQWKRAQQAERASRCEDSRWGVGAHSKLIFFKAAAWKSREWSQAKQKEQCRGRKCKVHLCMKKVERWQGSFARINVTDA